MRSCSLFALLLVACGPLALDEAKPPAEDCTNLTDDDEDGLVDCLDPDCASLCGEHCTDGIDNDGDGLVDCFDDQCDGSCAEVCDDERDNDDDGLIDCDDADCLGSCPEVCDDGYDNDGDTLIDCLDEDCTDPTCPEMCSDGRDNDADGRVDCDDPDCVSPACPEICDDGRDNDGDARADCDDSDCDGACPEVCDDLRDNDADGLVDCDDPECTPLCDSDGDGFYSLDYGGDDCDDSREDINPSRPEICNGAEALDDDCDGLVDELDPDLDLLSLIGWYPDVDGDSHGNNTEVLFACQQPEGWAAGNLDCDDSRPDVNPDMPEICNPDEPLDDDCDGLVDDADPDVDEESFLAWYADGDGDGWGSEGEFVYACSRPEEGSAPNNDDCDDADPDVGPPSLWYPDADGDGYGSGVPVDDTPTCEPPEPGLRPDWIGLDCDDRDPTIHPEAEEICDDAIDQDCDGIDSGCDFVIFVTNTFIGSLEDTWLWSRDDADAFCLDYASREGIRGTDFRIVYSNPEEDARDYLDYLPPARVFDREGVLVDDFDLWDGTDIRLDDMMSWTITGTWDDGRYHECDGHFPAGTWPICQYCDQKFACGSSSDNPFAPSACCWTGTRAVVCLGAL